MGGHLSGNFSWGHINTLDNWDMGDSVSSGKREPSNWETSIRESSNQLRISLSITLGNHNSIKGNLYNKSTNNCIKSNLYNKSTNNCIKGNLYNKIKQTANNNKQPTSNNLWSIFIWSSCNFFS